MNRSHLNFLFFFLMIILIIGSVPTSIAQVGNAFEISGMVIDSATRLPVEYASVAVYKRKDSSIISGSVTNQKGQFVIKGLSPGKYLIKADFIGYKTSKTPVEIVGQSIRLGMPVEISSVSLTLSEIQITGQQNAKQVTIEKTKINVSQNMSAVSGNVTDVLKSQSNITIDADDNVYLRGSSKILLLIDGRPTTVSSLNSISSSSVENIEIVTNPDARFDAEGTGGIINIITKRKKTEGFTASTTVNYGFLNRVNGGLNMNYSKNFWDVGLSYSGRYQETNISSILERELYQQNIRVDQDIQSTQISPGHNVSFSLAASPGLKNTLAAGLKFLKNNLHNVQSIAGQQTTDSLPATLFSRRNEVSWNRTTFEGSLSFKRMMIRNKHEISVDALYSQTKGSRPAEYYIDDELLQKSEAGGKPTNISIQADYIKNLFKRGKMEAGVKLFSRWNNFNSDFYDKDSLSSGWILNPAFSNDLELKEFIYSGYLMYSDTLLRKMYYKLGARLEYSTADLYQESTKDSINEKYLFPFPYLLLKYEMNGANSLALSLNRRVTRPTMGQLNPFIVVVDHMTFETGNKNLQPEILDKVEAGYSFTKEKIQLKTNLFFSTAKDFITQVTILTPKDELIVTYANGDRQNKTGIDIDANLKAGKILGINLGMSAFYAKSSGEYLGADMNSEGFSWTANLKLVVRPDTRTDIQLFLSYSSPVELPQFLLQEIYYADFGVKRTFFGNKLSIGLTVTDVFNTRNWIISADNSAYTLYNKSKSETRVVWLGLTLNLNSFKGAKSQKGEAAEGENGLIRLGQ